MRIVTLMGCVLLVGCARSVPVPVAVSCVPSALPAQPVYPDTDMALLAASGADQRYRLMIAGRALRTARLRELETVINECR